MLTFFRLVQYCDVQHRNIPRLRRQVPEPFLEIHPATAAAVSIQDGEWVILETATGRIRLKAKCKDFPASWGRRHRARLVAGLPGAGAAGLRPLWAGGGERQPSRLQRCH